MIQLRLGNPHSRPADDEPPVPRDDSLDRIERQLSETIADLAAVMDERRRTTVYVASETLMHAVTALMPAERMGVLAGRWIGRRFILTSLYDVTGTAHRAHVRADPDALGRALMAFERSGVELAAWVHSHPGTGPTATTPSGIDRQQYLQWSRDYGQRLIGITAVRDGHVRVWGEAIEATRVRIELLGQGVTPVGGHRHVYRLHA